MSEWMTLETYSETVYGTRKPTRSQRNSLARMCREGWLKNHSKKNGRKWLIRKEVLDD